MPDKAKSAKTKIKVEEIEDQPASAPVEEVEDAPKVEVIDSDTTSAELPKVSSFSQLDSDEKPQEEATPVETETAEEPVAQTEAAAPTVTPEIKTENTESPMSSEDVKEWLKEVRPDTSKEVVKNGGPNFKIILVFMLFLGMIGAIVGGVIYYKKGVTPSETPTESTPTEETTETPAASPTTEPEKVDLTKLSVNVLNGTGVPGVAGKTKTLIVAAGFTDSKVSTGNADATNYESTEIRLKATTPESVYTTLEKALSAGYTVVKSDKPIDDKSTYDVIVTVGKAK